MDVTDDAIPEELRAKVPHLLIIYFYDHGTLVKAFGFALCLISIHGPLFGASEHNAVLYVLAPIVGPIVPMCYFAIAPLHPYRGLAAQFAGLVDYHKGDREAKSLYASFRSSSARRLIVLASVKLAGLLVFVCLLLTLIFSQSLDFSISSSAVQGLVGCCIGSFLTIETEYIRSTLRMWSNTLARRKRIESRK